MAYKPIKSSLNAVSPAQQLKAGVSAKGRAFAKGCPQVIGEILKEVLLRSDKPIGRAWRKHTDHKQKGGNL